MRILFIGCSWSQIVPRILGKHSCPAAEFSKLLDTQHRIDISATGGSCVELHLEWLKQALAIAEYDFIFFQITASSRNYLRKEEWSEFTNNDWKYYMKILIFPRLLEIFFVKKEAISCTHLF